MTPTAKSDNRSGNRMTFDANGDLDEIVSSRGCHLERVDKRKWFLLIRHDDGTETAIWFTSPDLHRPFWEARPPNPASTPAATPHLPREP